MSIPDTTAFINSNLETYGRMNRMDYNDSGNTSEKKRWGPIQVDEDAELYYGFWKEPDEVEEESY